MARRVQLRALYSDRFLREIHHLLWSESSLSGSIVDAGWNCRDHAWVTTLLVRSLGHEPVIVNGEAYFIKGPNGTAGSVAYFQRPHSWVAIESVGAIDLSIKPAFHVNTDDFRLPVSCVFASDWIPRGRGAPSFFADGNAFARAVDALASRRNQVSAVYLIREAEQLHDGHLARAAGWIASPLTKRLDSVDGNPSDLHSALLIHLRSFPDGGAPSLSRLPSEEAWARLAERRCGAIDQARRLTGLTAEPSVRPHTEAATTD